MASGRETLHEIEQSIRHLRQQEQSLLNDMEADNGKRAKLIEQRTQAFRSLAEVRAKNAISDGVIDRADQLEHQVAGILQARQTTIDTLKTRAVDADALRLKLVDEAETLRTEIDGLEQRLDEIGDQAREQLTNDATYLERVAAHDAARSTFEKADEKTRTAEKDRLKKGGDYESDPLFMYLWKRKYGRDDYAPNVFVRMADDWLAKYIRYHDARANYAVLIEIPVRLREHCDSLKEDETETLQRVEDTVAAKIRELAGGDLTAALTQARQRQTEHNGKLEAVGAEITEISSQLNRYAQALDDSFSQAVILSSGFLENASYEQLVAQARSTVEPTDDQIVAGISGIATETRTLEKSVISHRRELEQIATRRQELLQVASQFRRAHYDDPGSVFTPNDAVGTLLEELLRGAISGGDFWHGTKRRHSWRGRPADPYRRDAGFPPFGSGGRSSGGGGFRTGGGF